MMKYSRVFFLILFVAMLMLSVQLRAQSVEANNFPASVNVKCSAALCAQLKEIFLVDKISDGNIDLYIEKKLDYDNLLDMLPSDGYSEGQGQTVTLTQTNQEATQNFTEISASGAAYHTYETMLSEIQTLESSNPAIIKVINLGITTSGSRNIWAVKVSDNVGTEEDEPSSFIAGGIHGNERPGPETVLHILNGIVSGYASNQQITDLVNKTQMWFIPIVNPDGHTANRRTNDNEVDLNRDYPATWANPQQTPTGQAETIAIIKNLQTRHYVVGLDFHTFGEMVMYPWAHTSSATQDASVFTALGNEIGTAMGGYQVATLHTLFGQIEGGSLDYEYGAFGTIAFGEELGQSHNPTITATEEMAQKNFAPALSLLGRVLKSTITGKVTDASSGEAVVATISVSGVDTSGPRNPYKSDSQFGRYYRLVPTGSYTVTVSAAGYATRTFQNIQVNNSAQTILDVSLSSGGSSSGGSSSGGSSSGGSSSGGSSSGGSSSGGNALSNGQTVTGLGAAQNQRTANYYIDVPTGASNLTISIAAGSGSTGDADLFVKKDSIPTDSSYDCRPWDSGSAETCGSGGDALATSAGRFHINVRAYSTFSNVNLTASYTAGGSSSGGSSSGGSSSGGSSSGGSSSGGSSSGGSSSGGLSNGQTVTGLGAAKDQRTANYYIDVPTGATNLTISIAAGSGSIGDADLFVKKGSIPTDSSYDCRPWDSGSDETCGTGGDALATSAGRFHINVRAYSTFSNVNLTASYTAGGSSSGGSSSGGSSSGGSSSGGSSSGGSSSGGSSSGGSSSGGLSNGQTITGLSAAANQRTANYYIDVPTGASNLSIKIVPGSGSTGDADLFVKKDTIPTDSSYDCRPWDNGSTETCGTGGDTLATSAGRFHINLRAYSAFTNVSLTASYDQ